MDWSRAIFTVRKVTRGPRPRRIRRFKGGRSGTRNRKLRPKDVSMRPHFYRLAFGVAFWICRTRPRDSESSRSLNIKFVCNIGARGGRGENQTAAFIAECAARARISGKTHSGLNPRCE